MCPNLIILILTCPICSNLSKCWTDLFFTSDTVNEQQNTAGYTYWEGFKKCPSPRMLGKSPPQTKKPKKKRHLSTSVKHLVIIGIVEGTFSITVLAIKRE